MRTWQKAVTLAVVQIGLVCSLGAKLLIDRARLPRTWVQVVPYDPDLPVRGRYLALTIELQAPSLPSDYQEMPSMDYSEQPPTRSTQRVPQPHTAHLEVRNGELVAVPDEAGSVQYQWPWTMEGARRRPYGARTAAMKPYLLEPVPFFVPEHAFNPAVRPAGEELWMEVTVPRKGPPRAIRLGIKKDGQIHPLEVR